MAYFVLMCHLETDMV